MNPGRQFRYRLHSNLICVQLIGFEGGAPSNASVPVPGQGRQGRGHYSLQLNELELRGEFLTYLS
jgi:hypothetical protein